MRSKLLLVIMLFFSIYALSDETPKLLEKLNAAKQDTEKVLILCDLCWENISIDKNKSVRFGQQAIELSGKIGFKKGLGQAHNDIATAYLNFGSYDSALYHLNKSLEIRKSLNDKKGIASVQSKIGATYEYMGKYKEAIAANFNAHKYFEEINDSVKILKSLGNIAQLFEHMGDKPNAKKYFIQAKLIADKLGDPYYMAYYDNQIINLTEGMKNPEKLLANYRKMLDIVTEQGNVVLQSNIINNIANCLKAMKNYREALAFYEKGLKIALESGDKHEQAVIMVNIGNLCALMKNYPQAISYYEKVIPLAREMELYVTLKDVYNNLAFIHRELREFEKALNYIEFAIIYNDSLTNSETRNYLKEVQTKFEVEKKELMIKNLGEKNELNEALIRKNKTIIFSMIAGVLLLSVALFFIFKEYRVNKLARLKISKQKEIIEEKNKEITDSIYYARRIQRALLTSEKYIRNYVDDFCIMYRPKDIISGDFYWSINLNNKFYFALADCTGHGVPGAFMSLMGINFLNEIMIEKRVTSPEDVLNALRDEIINALNPEHVEEESKDGMDLVLIEYDPEKTRLKFAAANNSLYHYHSQTKTLTEFKGDKMPVGKYSENFTSFTLQSIDINKGDSIYLFSDGFPDQFGGPKGKKFKYKELENLIATSATLPLQQQKEIFEKTFDNWKGIMEQVDDVTLAAIKF